MFFNATDRVRPTICRRVMPQQRETPGSPRGMRPVKSPDRELSPPEHLVQGDHPHRHLLLQLKACIRVVDDIREVYRVQVDALVEPHSLILQLYQGHGQIYGCRMLELLEDIMEPVRLRLGWSSMVNPMPAE